MRGRLVLVASVPIIVAAFAFYASRPRQPAYRGMPLEHWLKVLRSNAYDVAARQAVRQMGTNAIPALIQMLGREDSKFKTAFILWSENHSWVPLNLRAAGDQHSLGLRGFWVLESEATSAIPALEKLLKSPATAQYAAYAIAAIGPEATAPLMRAQTNVNPVCKAMANRGLQLLVDRFGLTNLALEATPAATRGGNQTR